MSWVVYVLYSKKDEKLYIGCTSDIKKRFEKHEAGHVPATAHRRPLVLIHTEIHDSKSKAFSRERFLKTLWGSREKKKILQKYLEG